MKIQSLFKIYSHKACLSILSILAIGCNSKENQSYDFGPEADKAEVQKALSLSTQSISPLNIKVGDFVHYSETQEINGQVKFVLSDTGQTVMAREDLPDRILLEIVENKVLYDRKGGSKKRTVDRTMVVAKSNQQNNNGSSDSGNSGDSSASPQENPINFNLNSLQTQLWEQVKAHTSSGSLSQKSLNKKVVTYHNLKQTTQQIPPPQAVAASADCRNVPNCNIRVVNISFDEVYWDGEPGHGPGEKIAYEFSISPDVPYMAALLNRCVTLLVEVDSSNGDDNSSKRTPVLVKQCSPVEDFQYGQESTNHQ